MKTVKRESRKGLALFLTLAMLLSMFSIVGISMAVADTQAEETVYRYTFRPTDYKSIETEGYLVEGITGAFGFNNVPDQPREPGVSKANTVAGSFIFESDAPITDWRLIVAIATTDWFPYDNSHLIALYSSVDGTDWEPVELGDWTLKNAVNPSWDNRIAYTGAFDAEDGVYFLKLDLPASICARTPALQEINYNKDVAVYVPPETYYHSFTINDPYQVESTGKLVPGPEESGVYVLFADNKSVGGSVVYKANEPIKDLSIESLQSTGWGGTGVIKYYASADGENWTELQLERTDNTSHNGGWVSYWETDKGGFSESDGYMYIKAEMGACSFYNLPGLKAIHYNTYGYVPPETYDRSFTINDPYQVESTGKLVPGPMESGVYVLFADNKSVGGSVVYKANEPIKDLSIESLQSTGWGGTGVIKYYASADGENWTELQLVRTDNISHNAGWASYWETDKGGFSESDGYVYIKAEMGACAFNNLPGLKAIRYNTYGYVPPETYDHSFTVNDPYQVESTGKLVPGPLESGVYVLFADDQSVGGSVVYKANEPIKDLSIESLQSTGWGGTGVIKYYASADGENWTELQLVRTDNTLHNGGWASYWETDKGGFSESDGYMYIKAEMGACAFNNLPGLKAIRYNTYASSVDPVPAAPKDKYEYELAANEGVATPDSPDGLFTNEPGFWYFHKGAFGGNEVTETFMGGTIVFHDDKAITDFCINAALGDDRLWAGDLKIAASVDGNSWVDVTCGDQKLNSINDGWRAYYHNLFASLDAADDYHYLRVTAVSGWGFARLPGVCYLRYSTEGYDGKPKRPASYINTMGIANYFEYTSEGVLTDVANDAALFMKDGVPVAGDLLLKSCYHFTDFDLRLVEKIGDTSAVRVTVSSDGGDYRPLYAERELVRELGDGYGLYSYYGTYTASDRASYMNIALPADDGTAPAFCQLLYNVTGSINDKDAIRRPYVILENSEDIDDLDMKHRDTSFAGGNQTGVWKLEGLDLTNNGTNADYIGGTFGLVTLDYDTNLHMYTPNLRDFKVRAAFGIPGNMYEIRAFGRSSQYGEETEIPLMRVVYKEGGFVNYVFRPADRDALPQDILYVRVELRAEIHHMNQIMDFDYYYDGPDPGETPVDERDIEGLYGTERKGVKSYNFVTGFPYVHIENFSPTANNANSGYIGTKQGFVPYPDFDKESVLVMDTTGISNFWLKVVTPGGYLDTTLKLHIYVAPKDDDSLYVELPIKYEFCEKQPTGWSSVEFVPATAGSIPEGTNFLKVVLEGGIGTSMQLARLDFEFTMPALVPLPDFRKPDTAKGEQELMDTFNSAQPTNADDGKAVYAVQLQIEKSLAIGTDNPRDAVLKKRNSFAESYIIYEAEHTSRIDVRAYKSPYCEYEDVLVYVSPDGSTWTLLDIQPINRDLYNGWVNTAYIADESLIPAGTHYVKIEIPELTEDTDLTISDVQLLYGVDRTVQQPVIDDQPEDPDNGENPGQITDPDDGNGEDPDDDKQASTPKKKVIRKHKKSSGDLLPWWGWVLIAVGVVVVAGGVVLTVILVKKRKKGTVPPASAP